MYAYTNLREYAAASGFDLRPLEQGQGERFCGTSSRSFHCVEMGATACDWGTAEYSVDTLWAIFNLLLPFAQGTSWLIAELIWQDIFWQFGKRVTAIDGHDNHVHSALGVGRRLPMPTAPPPPVIRVGSDPLLLS